MAHQAAFRAEAKRPLLHEQATLSAVRPSQSEKTSNLLWPPSFPSSPSAPARKSDYSSPRFLAKTLFAFAALSTLYFWSPLSVMTAQQDPIEAILKETPFIDTHIDFPFFLSIFNQSVYGFTVSDTLQGQVDFPRLEEGKLGASFWSVFVPCPGLVDNGDYSDEHYKDAVAQTFYQIDLVHRLVARFPDRLSLTTTSSSIFHNHQFPPPYQTIGSVIGGEGLHSIGNKVSNLRLMHQLGMRYMTLTHNCHNIYADAALSEQPPQHGGLSKKGKALILEFNRMGMMVDLSHVSADTMRDALAVSEAPIIFSHSGAYGVNAHPRNVPDDVLDMVKKNKGVVQVNFYPEYIAKNASEASLFDVADHIQYIGKRIGYEHLGIGSDFDGMEKGVIGLEDVSKYPALLRELWKRGLSYKELSGIVGANLLRVMQDVELVAARSTRQPLEDDIDFGLPVNSSAQEVLEVGM